MLPRSHSLLWAFDCRSLLNRGACTRQRWRMAVSALYLTDRCLQWIPPETFCLKLRGTANLLAHSADKHASNWWLQRGEWFLKNLLPDNYSAICLSTVQRQSWYTRLTRTSGPTRWGGGGRQTWLGEKTRIKHVTLPLQIINENNKKHFFGTFWQTSTPGLFLLTPLAAVKTPPPDDERKSMSSSNHGVPVTLERLELVWWTRASSVCLSPIILGHERLKKKKERKKEEPSRMHLI